MRPLISDLWHHHRWLLVAFSTALVLTLFFAVKLFLFAPHWMGPRPDPGPIAGWMTPKFLVHAYHLPPGGLERTLGYAFQQKNPQTLSEIAVAKGVTVIALIAKIQAQIDKMKPGDAHHGGGPNPPDAAAALAGTTGGGSGD